MRALFGFVVLAMLVGCGEQPPSLPAAQSVEAQASPQAADAVSAGDDGYVHVPRIGERSQEVDPVDLEGLARKVIACSSQNDPLEYINEPRALQLGRAARDGRQLRVGGKTLVDYGPVVMDGVARSHDAAFFYFGVLKALDLDVVYVNLPEDQEYQLVDAATGTSANMEGLPVASPSGRYLVAFGDDAMNFLGINIVERDKSGLKQAKAIETLAYPCGLTWLSDTKASFQELKPSALEARVQGPWRQEISQHYGTAFIELRDGEWTYTPATD